MRANYQNCKTTPSVPEKTSSFYYFLKTECCLFILILLFQFFPSFFFLQGGSLVWAIRFQTSPQVIDDVDEDTVFSPNGDGIQDTLLISFITDGDLGDFRIIIDTHGPSGVGRPDNQFRVDEDWVITGQLGSGIDEDDHPKQSVKRGTEMIFPDSRRIKIRTHSAMEGIGLESKLTLFPTRK